MFNCFVESISDKQKLIPIIPIISNTFSSWLATQTEFVKNLVALNDFKAKSSSHCFIPNQVHGGLDQILLGINNADDFWAFGALPSAIKCGGVYQIVNNNLSQEQLQRALIAWGLGNYRFTKYKKNVGENPQLLVPGNCDKRNLYNILSAVYLVRDLINTPAEDMNPIALAEVAKNIAEKFNASFSEIVGDDLLKNNFPGIHMVGRASIYPPRLVVFKWGDTKLPKVTIVGKGVCFDSGGLDLKPASGMEAMKKDMGGAAHALGLAQMIMSANLPIHLEVIIPIVENLVSGSSCKPGDVVRARNGITVEIINTDAEGRVILSDALSLACETSPGLLIDFATLTGAARIALGTGLPAMFVNDDDIAEKILVSCKQENDPAWRMPLFSQYNDMIDSAIADIKNSTGSSYGGAITAALFLQKFVEQGIKWIHFDIMAANVKTMPGRPEGGEAMCLRALFNYLQKQFTA